MYSSPDLATSPTSSYHSRTRSRPISIASVEEEEAYLAYDPRVSDGSTGFRTTGLPSPPPDATHTATERSPEEDEREATERLALQWEMDEREAEEQRLAAERLALQWEREEEERRKLQHEFDRELAMREQRKEQQKYHVSFGRFLFYVSGRCANFSGFAGVIG